MLMRNLRFVQQRVRLMSTSTGGHATLVDSLDRVPSARTRERAHADVRSVACVTNGKSVKTSCRDRPTG